MLRIALTLSLTLHVALATGKASVFEERVCTQTCPDDDAQGNCAPDCADCICCPHLRVMAVYADAKVQMPSSAWRVPERNVSAPVSPEPDEILHVPKTRLA